MRRVEIRHLYDYRAGDDWKKGDLVYSGHTLMRITRIGKPRTKRGHPTTIYKFRVIGRINLDRQFRERTEGKEEA